MLNLAFCGLGNREGIGEGIGEGLFAIYKQQI